jgi:hypothetical protein
MLTRQISFSAPIFFLIFLFQEAVMNQFKLPGGGFSLFGQLLVHLILLLLVDSLQEF